MIDQEADANAVRAPRPAVSSAEPEFLELLARAIRERERQIAMGHDAAHDDALKRTDLDNLLVHRVARLSSTPIVADPQVYQRRLLELGTVAFAIAASLERQYQRAADAVPAR